MIVKDGKDCDCDCCDWSTPPLKTPHTSTTVLIKDSTSKSEPKPKSKIVERQQTVNSAQRYRLPETGSSDANALPLLLGLSLLVAAGALTVTGKKED